MSQLQRKSAASPDIMGYVLKLRESPNLNIENLFPTTSIMNTEEIKCESCGSTAIRIIRSGGKTRLCKTCKSDRQKARCKSYKKNNKGRVATYNAEYKQVNKKQISEYNKKYDKVNRDKIQAQRTVYRRKKLKEDPSFKMAVTLRNRLGCFIKKKDRSQSTEELLGCTYDDFTMWINFRLEGKYEFKDHGKLWHLDHVIPCAKFDLTDPNEIEKCFHWTNIQPLPCSENIAKNDSTTIEEQQNQLDKIKEFVEEYGDKISDKMNLLEYDRFIYVQ